MLTQLQLSHARLLRERGMVDACTIRASGGTPGTFDPETGTTPVTPHTPHYSGVCQVKDPTTTARELVTGEQEVTVQAHVVEVPWDVTTVEPGHILTVTTSRDPWLTGRELKVVTVRGETNGSARVLLCTADLG